MNSAAVQKLNSLAANDADKEFLKCCGSRNWAQQMVDARPYPGLVELLETSERIWWALEPADWLEAFHSHPKIGEKKAAAETARQASEWSADEQSGIRNSTQTTIDALANLNRIYEEKFGFIFIVCAWGKSSEEMLANLRERLANEPDEELRNAAVEQAKITKLRLEKLVTA